MLTLFEAFEQPAARCGPVTVRRALNARFDLDELVGLEGDQADEDDRNATGGLDVVADGLGDDRIVVSIDFVLKLESTDRVDDQLLNVVTDLPSRARGLYPMSRSSTDLTPE